MKQYVVWSLIDNLYRVFVYEEYYQKFKILYQKEINIIYMNFLEELLKKRLKIIKKKFFCYFLIILISLIFLFCFSKQIIFNDIKIILIVFILNLVFLFFYTNIKQKQIFKNYKKKILKETMEKVKFFLSVEVFEDISKQQKFYSPEVSYEKEK